MNAVQERSLPRVKRLLELRADPSAKDDRGFTSLHRAAEMGELDIARLLLEAGADPRPEALGHTPLSLARMRGHAGIAELIEAARP
jgi:ankyrin repeat protein